MDLKKRLGLRIKELRIKNCYNQAELAERVGIATKHQSCIETGRNFPSSDLIEKYAKAFAVDTSEILNIEHINDTKNLREEIRAMVQNAKDEDIIMIYKILKSVSV